MFKKPNLHKYIALTMVIALPFFYISLVGFNLYYSTFKNGKITPAQITSIEQIGEAHKFIDYRITYLPEINSETAPRSTRVYSIKNINKSDRLDSYYAIRNSKTHILAIEAKPLLTRSILYCLFGFIILLLSYIRYRNLPSDNDDMKPSYSTHKVILATIIVLALIQLLLF